VVVKWINLEFNLPYGIYFVQMIEKLDTLL